MLGAPQSDPQGIAEAGSAHLFKARSTPGDISVGAASYHVFGDEVDAELGFAIDGGGDVNGDGIPDLIVGAFRTDGNDLFDSGAAGVFFGDAGRSGFDLAGEADLLINGQDVEDHLGWAVNISGDYNGDGIHDIVVGAPLGDTTLLAPGEAFLFLGGSHLTSGSILNPGAANVYFRGEEAGSGCGQVLAAGDINGDGRSDLVLGAPGEDWSGRFNAGGVFVFLGRTDWGPADLLRVQNDYDMAIMGGFASDAFGSAVAVAGDMNNDGFDDIVVGAPLATESGETFRGRAYIFAGRTIGSRITLDSRSQASSTLRGDDPGDLVGASVGSARDFNSDGNADVLIGAPGDDPGSRDGAGSAFLFYGQAGTFPPSGSVSSFASRQYIGLAAGDEAGAAVGAVGDFNLDGSTDIVIGAPGVDVGSASSAGRVYLFSGIATLGVDASIPVLEVRAAFPNPTRRGITLPLRARSTGRTELTILDATGRLVRAIRIDAEVGSEHDVEWDGNDTSGRPVRAGVYFVTARGLEKAIRIVVAP